jgi:hypothetical protein
MADVAGSDTVGEPAAVARKPAAAARESGVRLPDFFVVGHPKSGTTALYRMLNSHPQIFMTPMKETRFFSPELRSRYARFGPDRLPQTLDAYLALFAGARPDQRTGEASPSYLRSHMAARRIADVAPEARIIAILREPASFLRSFHLQSVHNNNETEKDFAKAIALEPARRAGRRIPLLCAQPKALMYSDHVRYVEQLRRYHELFGRERVLVLVYEDYRRDNAATVRTMLRFLEVDDTVPIVPAETETLPAVRSQLLHQLARVVRVARRNPNARSPLLRVANALIPRGLQSARFEEAWRRLLYTEARTPDERFMQELRRRFKPEVVALSEYLGRDFVTLWGYDRLE